MAKVLGPFEQLEREFSGNSVIDHEFLLTKLVASEASFLESRTRNKAVSAEEVAKLLTSSSSSSSSREETLQPPPNFQDIPLLAHVKPAGNYNNVDLSHTKVDTGEEVIYLKTNSKESHHEDVPELPPKPVQRKESPPSGRFRSGKKRPPPPPPPRNDRPKCPQPELGVATPEIEAPMVEIDLTKKQPPSPTPEVQKQGPEIIERYPSNGNHASRFVPTPTEETATPDELVDSNDSDVEPEDDDDDDDEEGQQDEEGEQISLDYSVLDLNEDISIPVPNFNGNFPTCNMSAADLADMPVIPIGGDVARRSLDLGEERDEAHLLEDVDAIGSAEFQITAVTSGSDVFFPYHWSVTSHLATIGEDEEDEVSQPDTYERSTSLCEDTGARQRDVDTLVPAVLGSDRNARENSKLANNEATMEESNDDESKLDLSTPGGSDMKQIQLAGRCQDKNKPLCVDIELESNQKQKARVTRPSEESIRDAAVPVLCGDEPSESEVVSPEAPRESQQEPPTGTDITDKGVRDTMDALLALDTLTSSSHNNKTPYLQAQMSPNDNSLSPPPSFSRLPPDGHEFPTNYQEPNHFNVGVPAIIEVDFKQDKMPAEIHLLKPSNDLPPPPLPSSIPPQKVASYHQEVEAYPTPAVTRNYSASSAPSGAEDVPSRPRPLSWRKDEKSEQSVRDKIAMFASQKDRVAPQTSQITTARRLSNTFKSSENVFFDDDNLDRSPSNLSSVKPLSRSVVSVDKIGQSNNSPPFRQITNPQTDNQDHDGLEVNEESPRSFDYNGKTLSSMDLISSSSSTYSSCTPDSSLSSISSYSMGYSSTLPRKLSNNNNNNNINNNNNNRQSPAPSPFVVPSRRSGTTEAPGNISLHTRSQSLVDVAVRPTRHSISYDPIRSTTEDSRRASLNVLIENRRRNMTKLRGLVIPEKVMETIPSKQYVFDLPEIKSRESILATKPALLKSKEDPRLHNDKNSLQNNSWSSTNPSYQSLDKNSSLSSPPWKSQTTANNLPKYSPAFKRKSLAVCGTSSTASSVSSSLNSSREELRSQYEGTNIKSTIPPLPPSKPPRNPTSVSNNLSRNNIPTSYSSQFLYNQEPPKSLESITSPTRSDSSFEYIRESSPDQGTHKNGNSNNNGSILHHNHKKASLTPSHKSISDRGRSGEDDSDNDSAVSSSRSSISHDFSPPQSPIPDSQSQDIQLHTTSQHILLSPLPSSGSGTDRRPLRRTLSSETTASVASSTASTLTSGSQASCSSNGGSSSDNGRRVLKAQSVEAINRKNVLSSARYSSGRDLKVGSPLIKRKFEDEEERSDCDERDEDDVTQHDDSDFDQCNGDGSEVSKDVMFYSSYPLEEAHDNNVRIAYLEIMTSENEYNSQGNNDVGDVVSNGKSEEELPEIIPVAAPRRSNVLPTNVRKEANGSEDYVKQVVESPKRVNPSDAKNVKTATIETKLQDSVEPIKPNGHDLSNGSNGVKAPTVASKPLSRRTSNNNASDSLPTENELMNILGRTQQILRQKSKEQIKELSKTTKSAEKISPPLPSRNPPTATRTLPNRRSVSVNDIRKAFEKAELALHNSGRANNGNVKTSNGNSVHNNHARVSSLDSTTSEDSCAMQPAQYGSVTSLQHEQFGSITSLASSTSLISPQELQGLIDEANQALEEQGGGNPPNHEVHVVVLYRELSGGSVGITLAGGADYEAKEITVHKVLGASAADRDGRIQKGDRILSINGKSMKGVTHRESLNILKAPRTEVILVVSRPRADSVDGTVVASNSSRPPRILEQPQEGATSSGSDGEGNTPVARGPAMTVTLLKEGAGLGFSLEGGKDSPLGDKPLIIKKIFMGGSADKSGLIRAGDELLKVNQTDISSMSRIEAWGLMKKLADGKVALTVRHKVENKSR